MQPTHTTWLTGSVLLLLLVACGDDGSQPAADAGGEQDVGDTSLTVAPSVIAEDATFDGLLVEADQTTLVDNGAQIEVLGDLVIDGRLEAVNGPLYIAVSGDLTVRGTLAAVHADAPADDPERPFFSQPSGLYLVVEGSFSFEETSRLETNGNLVLTDDVDELELTPASVSAEARTNAGELPTLVLLPPDHPDFDSPEEDEKALAKQAGARDRSRFAGTIDLKGGDAEGRVLVIRTYGNDDLELDGLRIVGTPAGRRGEDEDNRDRPGVGATAEYGLTGFDVLLWSARGSIVVTGQTSVTLSDGGRGGDAAAICESAFAGDGGASGGLRLTAACGIDLCGGQLMINPGRGGDGGDAVVERGDTPAPGCPAEWGCPATAQGGTGGAASFRLGGAGNVDCVENLVFARVRGGHGGSAQATAGHGAQATPCCPGGRGGDARAAGGFGGPAVLRLPPGIVFNLDVVIGGDGGDADATGGSGGDGATCKLVGGDGGLGGDATAEAGGGGEGRSNGAGITAGVGGDGGTATAVGADGGDGGDAVLEPGDGAQEGIGFDSPGRFGPGSGIDGREGEGSTGTDGMAGEDGDEMPPDRLWDLPLWTIADGVIEAGTHQVPLREVDGDTDVGSVDVELVSGSATGEQDEPESVTLSAAELSIDLDSIELDSGDPQPVSGIKLTVRSGAGISADQPLRFEAYDAAGSLVDERLVTALPSPSGGDDCIVVYFDPEHIGQLAVIRIVMPDGSTLELSGITLLC